MKRVIKSSTDQNILGKWAYYFELEDPAEWGTSDTDEVLKEYTRLCMEDEGCNFIGLIEAKDLWYNYLGTYADLIAATNASGEVRLLEYDYRGEDHVKDVTDRIEYELAHFDEMQDYM